MIIMLTAGNTIQWIAICLLGLAVIMVNSAGMSLSRDPIDGWQLLLGRPTLYGVMAVVALLVAGRYDLRKLIRDRMLKHPVFWLLVIALGLCVLAFVPGFSAQINGSRRWLRLGPRAMGLTFQPSELVKWLMIPALAWWATRGPARLSQFVGGLMPVLLLVALAGVLIGVEDLGTAVLIGTVSLIMLIAGGARIWHLLMFVPLGLAGVIGLIIKAPYRVKRLLAFVDPWSDPEGIGYHPIQSLVAIYSGRHAWGLGGGLQKQGYLPADTTDFIFPVICEELGMAGGLLVIGLYAALIWMGWSVFMQTRSRFARLVVLGITVTVGMQALINLAVTTVLVPSKGIALPLISSGGTGWIVCAAALGVIAAVDRLNEQQVDWPDAVSLLPAENQQQEQHQALKPSPVVRQGGLDPRWQEHDERFAGAGQLQAMEIPSPLLGGS